MRFRQAIFAATGILLASLAIVWSGAQLTPKEPAFEADPADISDADIVVPAPEASEEAQPTTQSGQEEPDMQTDESAGLPDLQPFVPEPDKPADSPAAPQNETQTEAPVEREIERLPPRPPLGESELLKQSAPATASAADDWKSTRLFKPVVSSAATIEAQGYRIALAGVEPLSSEQKCTFDGKEWPCGLLARTAFRSWLRGRAVSCVVPPEPNSESVAAECHVGKTDISEWVVTNGWAKAVADGPYVDAGRKAAEARKGIFGPGPTKRGIDLPRVADPSPMAFPETEPAPDIGLEEPSAQPPPAQPPLSGPFPPAPMVQ